MAQAAPPAALPSDASTGGLLILRGEVITESVAPPSDQETLRGAPLDSLHDWLDSGWVYLWGSSHVTQVTLPARESVVSKATRLSKLPPAQRAQIRRDRPLDVRLSRHAFASSKRPVHDLGLQD